MKLNKISIILAAMAIVGCSSEDVSDFTENQAIEDSRLIELNPNFILAGVGEDDAVTRTHWEKDAETGALVNKFLPIYAEYAGGRILGDVADLKAQAVGLCWLGNGAVGPEVYTNYQFYHFGWLNKGETEADIDKCDSLYNGSLYSEIGNIEATGVTNTLTSGTFGEEANPTDWGVDGLPSKSKKGTEDLLNYNSGVYKTDNKAIFGGQYIVYYPFDSTFVDIGTIPAIADTMFSPAPTTFTDPELGKATFRYSSAVTIEGGDRAADFALQNLSTLVRLRVSTVSGDANLGDAIDQIVLYSPTEKLLRQANLAADRIVAGKKGAELYASTVGVKTVTAIFGGADGVELKTTNDNPTSAYITVLPTTVDDLVVLVHNKTKKTWARVNKPNTVFEAGKAKVLDICVKEADFTSEYIAVDEVSLTQALTDARQVAVDKNHAATITVIGDITLASSTYDIAYGNDINITITGDAIIVPEDVTLYVKTNMESEIRVLGKSCCSGTYGGKLSVQGGTLHNVTMKPTEARITNAVDYDQLNPVVTYSDPTTIAAGSTFDVQAGNVYVGSAVQHKGNLNIAEGAKLTVWESPVGNLNFLGSKVVNNGTIEVKKAGSFNLKNSDGGSTWAVGQNMTNNGTFIHNVDAVVGTACQNMQGEGEYRCRVDKQKALDDAYMQWTRCSVIEIIDAGEDKDYDLGNACQHNGKYIDIEVNSIGYTTTFYNPAVSGTNDGDSKDIQIGNLTVTDKAGGLFVDFVTGDGQRTLTVNGNMVVKANTTLTDSKKINVTGNLTVEGAGVKLTYNGDNKNVEGLAVAGDITVTDAEFDASADNAILIGCKNFSLIKKATGATATFGNRTEGNTNKSMTVKGTISNAKGCTFTISPADGANLLAWITCYETTGGGVFAGDPTVVKP